MTSPVVSKLDALSDGHLHARCFGILDDHSSSIALTLLRMFNSQSSPGKSGFAFPTRVLERWIDFCVQVLVKIWRLGSAQFTYQCLNSSSKENGHPGMVHKIRKGRRLIARLRLS